MGTLVKLLLGETILGQKAFPGCCSREGSWDMTLCPACGPSGPKEPRREGEMVRGGEDEAIGGTR